MIWKRFIAVPVLALALGASGLGTGTALAAPGGGQHISYINRDAGRQCTTGQDQFGHFAQSCGPLHRGVNPAPGPWFRGPVRITWFRPGRNVVSVCQPTPRGDFRNCNEPR